MSLFSCPNASRSLLRVAARGVAAKTVWTIPSPFAPSRWISGCAAVTRPRAVDSSRGRGASFQSSYPNGCRRTFFADQTIRKYEDLPKDYRDQAGLPFRSLDLTESEVLQIFGRGINAKRANHLLRILHGRRVAGTLDDPAFAIHTQQFTKDQKAKALEYLRKSIPVNEIMNAGLRAEDELAALEVEMETTENEKSAAKAKTEEPAPVAPKEVYTPDPVYGHSRFDEIRARNVAKRKAQEAAEEEERRKAIERGEVASGPLAKVKNEERQIANPKIAEYHKGAQSDLEAPPELKAWERILPSATVAVLVVGFLMALATVYEEPSPHFRLFPNISTATATVGTIIAVNALVFIGWRTPPLWKMFNKYMIVVVATMKPVTLFTAQFSHQGISHFLWNMIPLWFVGTHLHEEIGRADFLTLYLASGALGFVGSLATYTLRGMLGVTTLGASASLLGVCSAYLWGHRNDGFKIFGFPDEGVHGIVFLAMLFVPQLVAFGKTAKYKLDVASHVVGMLVGILGMEYISRSKEPQEKRVISILTPPVSKTPQEFPGVLKEVEKTK